MNPLNLVCEIVASYVAHNRIQHGELPGLIRLVHSALVGELPLVLTPAVPISESVQHGHIFCLEDGQKLSSLKIHLRKAHGLTPTEYRDKWNLSASYPMTAPASSDKKSQIARASRFGYHPDKNPNRWHEPIDVG